MKKECKLKCHVASRPGYLTLGGSRKLEVSSFSSSDIYCSKRGLETRITKLIKDSTVLDENKHYLLDFVHSMQAQGIKPRRLTKSIHMLSIVSRLLNKDCKKALNQTFVSEPIKRQTLYICFD